MNNRAWKVWLAAALLLTGLACSGAADPAPSPPPATSAQSSESGEAAESHRNWSVVGERVSAEFATPDLATGERRFAAVLYDSLGLIKIPVIRTSSYFYPEGVDGSAPREGPIEETIARFYEFPLGTRGIYVTNLRFDRVGDWSVEAAVPKPDGTADLVEIRFPVAESTMSVDKGERPPASRNRTLADVDSIAELTTGTQHDPELYAVTVSEALEQDRPFVVVFASPAFCTNAVCGPQVEVASALREQYGDRISFIHVDLYQNPHEIKGDLSSAVVTPLLEEWGLVSQEWTFVMGADGKVAARFENFVPHSELEEALLTVLPTS